MSGASLREVLAGAPLVVCLGPGGVGKTTVSAVLALHAAACQRRSLVLTIDPARRLADALNVSGLTNDPVEVTSFAKMHVGGTLSALMLDPAATFDHMIAMLVPDGDRRQLLLGNRFYQHISRSLAGTLEYMAVERLHDLTASEQFDTIVLDTPPTTNALDFLEAPDRIATFFGERVIRWFLPNATSRSWATRLFDRAGAAVQGLMARVAGQEFVEETVGFFAAFGDLIGDFRKRGERISELLRAPETVFLVVCSPDRHRLDEACEIDRRLQQAGRQARAFIVNRVDRPFLPDWVDAEPTISRATTLLGGHTERERVRVFIERLERLRKDRDNAAHLHAQAIATLREHAGERPVFCGPRVPAGNSPRAALLAIYVGLFAAPARQEPQAMVH